MARMHAVIDVPADRREPATGFWSAVLGWPAGESWPGHAELRSFEPPVGLPYVHLQEIEGGPRVHLDLEAEEGEVVVGRAVGLGARVVGESDRWQTLLSPGGLPFCVLATAVDDRPPPPPVTWPDGHRTRLVQVCVDSPAPRHPAEVAFWRDLLAGRWVDSPAREFAGKWHDDLGSPVQLLFQRLDEPDGPVRAHLDLGTDDLPAEVSRLVDLGAEDVGPGRGWHVLRDPVGLPFCATENSPACDGRRDLG
jgi:hypothetical protein